jgi:hypothetical protein
MMNCPEVVGIKVNPADAFAAAGVLAFPTSEIVIRSPAATVTVLPPLQALLAVTAAPDITAVQTELSTPF